MIRDLGNGEAGSEHVPSWVWVEGGVLPRTFSELAGDVAFDLVHLRGQLSRAGVAPVGLVTPHLHVQQPAEHPRCLVAIREERLGDQRRGEALSDTSGATAAQPKVSDVTAAAIKFRTTPEMENEWGLASPVVGINVSRQRGGDFAFGVRLAADNSGGGK